MIGDQNMNSRFLKSSRRPKMKSQFFRYVIFVSTTEAGRERKSKMRKIWVGGAAVTLLATLALPVQMGAQENQNRREEYPRFKLIDVGTFGGPNAGVNGPTIPIISSNGTYAGEAETAIPDPTCQGGPDCLVTHAQEWRNGVVIDLGTLPGVNLSSGSTWVSANGIIGGDMKSPQTTGDAILSNGSTL
jgi:hypothetical protein